MTFQTFILSALICFAIVLLVSIVVILVIWMTAGARAEQQLSYIPKHTSLMLLPCPHCEGGRKFGPPEMDPRDGCWGQRDLGPCENCEGTGDELCEVGAVCCDELEPLIPTDMDRGESSEPTGTEGVRVLSIARANEDDGRTMHPLTPFNFFGGNVA